MLEKKDTICSPPFLAYLHFPPDRDMMRYDMMIYDMMIHDVGDLHLSSMHDVCVWYHGKSGRILRSHMSHVLPAFYTRPHSHDGAFFSIEKDEENARGDIKHIGAYPRQLSRKPAK